MLISPALKLNDTLAALNDSIDPMFSVDTLSGFKAAYCPGGIDPLDARQSPLVGDFAGLPALHIVVGGAELLKADSVEAAEKARASGVPVQFTLVHGLPHVFPLIDVLPEAVKAQREIFAFLRARLARAG